MQKLFSHTNQRGIRRTFTLPVGSHACEAVEYVEHMVRVGAIVGAEVESRVYDVVANYYFNSNVSVRHVVSFNVDL